MTADGIVIMVRVTPRSGRDSVESVAQLARLVEPEIPG